VAWALQLLSTHPRQPPLLRPRACDTAPHTPTEGGKMEKGKGWRSGFRVFRVHVDRGNLERLRRLFRDFADGSVRVKGVLRYRDE